MKGIIKRAIRDESGKVLIMVLILLVVGGLVLTPLLGLMQTGLIAGQVYERKAAELYAADAGVEEAIWRIPDKLIWEDNESEFGPITVNEKNVRVELERDPLRRCPRYWHYRYYIRSKASANGSSTTVNAVLYVLYNAPLDFSGLLDYAIASDGAIHLASDGEAASEIHGDVYIRYRELFQGNEDCIKGEHKLYDHTQVEEVDWPTFGDLSPDYLKEVENYTYDSGSIDIKHETWVGPLYRDGDLSIYNTGDSDTLELGGTVYIKGDLEFEQRGRNSGYTVDLRGQTIFVDGTIDISPQFITITGSGCIIARGDITLLPVISNTEGEYVLLLSLEGSVQYLPQAPTPWNEEPEFYGTVAGRHHVKLNPLQRIHWTDWRGKGLNFPTGEAASKVEDPEELPMSDLSIVSWQIEQGGQ